MAEENGTALPPEGFERMSSIDPKDLARVLMVLPEELSPASVAEIMVNILLNYDMQKELAHIFNLTHAALNHPELVRVLKSVEVDTKKGTN